MEIACITHQSILENNFIIKPNYHLNYGKRRIETAINQGMPFLPLSECTNEIYTGGIFKRIFVENPDHGIPYVTAQHMMHFNPLEVAKLISRKYTPRQDDMTLREGQILVSCAGTVGNVRMVDNFLDGVIGSQDIIRVIAREGEYPLGFIYAYLSSKTAYNYIQSFIYGSVVPRIDPATLGKLPVPDMPSDVRDSVHTLMTDASCHRSSAYFSLKETIECLESVLPEFSVPKVHYEEINESSNARRRLDARYSGSALRDFYDAISSTGVEIKTISELSKLVFTPNIFKRIKVARNHKGIPYLGGAELLHYHPSFDTFLSRKTKDLETYLLREGYLALQDSGSIQSIGYVSIVPSFLNDVAATNNLVRVVPKEEHWNLYIYAFLKTKQANSILKSMSYGTGQLHIDNTIVESLKIPIFPELVDQVKDGVLNYLKSLEQAYYLEIDAIQQIENKIDQWQN